MRWLLFLVLCVPCTLFAQGRNMLAVTHLTGNFYVYTTYKMLNGTTFPANGMYVVTSDGVVLFDTPWDTTQFSNLLMLIEHDHHMPVILCIATHSHEDRTGGLEYYRRRGIRTYTTRMTDSISAVRGEKRAEYLMLNDTMFSIGQYAFRVFYPGPGHTPDNIVVWFPKERILYGGCFIKSTDSPDLGNLADANPDAWPQSIKNIQDSLGKPEYTVTGHQGFQDNKGLDHTLKLLKKYQKQHRNVKVKLEKHMLFDSARNRAIPVAYYIPKKSTGNRQVVIINHGYGQNYSDSYLSYSYIAKNLAAKGYFVVSIQHELPTDSLMPTVGIPKVVRRPFWDRGTENILFVINTLKNTYPSLDFKHITLIGHSNGGDMAVLFPQKYGIVTKIITLDNRRMNLPQNPNVRVYSLRSSDLPADEGVLLTPELQRTYHMTIIQLPDTRHNDMDDHANKKQRREINMYIEKFLKE